MIELLRISPTRAACALTPWPTRSRSARPDRPWTAPWAQRRAESEHFVAGRHTDSVLAVAVGELDGRAIAVSGSNDQPLRVWDHLAGSQLAVIEVGAPIRAVEMRSTTILVAANTGVMAIDLSPAKPPE